MNITPAILKRTVLTKKWLLPSFIFTLISVLSCNLSYAQTEYDTSKYYLVTKNDGTQYQGKIIKSDDRELLLKTATIGNIYIPKHEIKSIKVISAGEISSSGTYIGEDEFATRHFLTTNGHALGKSKSYAQINLWGPEVEFGVSDKLSVGIMTSWLAVPIVGTVKYSIELDQKVHLGVGALVGTGSWVNASSFGALPFGALTFGDRKNNITFSGGMLALGSGGDVSTQVLMSAAALSRISKKVTFVFDSFIVPGSNNSSIGTTAILTPGLRFSGTPEKSFQFGFGAIMIDNIFVPLPIPVLSWLRAF